MFREVLAKLEAQRDGLAAAIDVLRPYADAETTIVVTVEPAVARRAPKRKALRAAPRAAAKRRSASADTTLAVRQVTAARDYALLQYLREHNGMAESRALAKAMPKEASLTAEQRVRAYSNTMSRLKSLGYVARSGSVWSLTEKGRLAA